jgi:uncharacterized membrane-anchored protein YhcB (DUF1043 family)
MMHKELSETCRVSLQNKFEKSAHLVGFIIRKFVIMHGHMNVKIKELTTAKQRKDKRINNCQTPRVTCYHNVKRMYRSN